MITVTINKWRKAKVTPVIVTGTVEPPVGKEELLIGREALLDLETDSIYIEVSDLTWVFPTDINDKRYASFFASDFTYKEGEPNVQ